MAWLAILLGGFLLLALGNSGAERGRHGIMIVLVLGVVGTTFLTLGRG